MSVGNVPGVTANAQLLLGFIGGSIMRFGGDDLSYRIVESDAAAGWQIVENTRTGNTYRIAVEQIGGQP